MTPKPHQMVQTRCCKVGFVLAVSNGKCKVQFVSGVEIIHAEKLIVSPSQRIAFKEKENDQNK